MKRIKLVLATVAAMVVMIVAAVSPAVADHGWWVSGWYEWGDGWWCYEAWEHESDGEWDLEYWVCWHEDYGFWVGED